MKSFREYASEKTLYVSRDLLNGADVVEWAKKNGCTTCLKPEKMHVTLCYSKTPMKWPKPLTDQVSVWADEHREVKKFDGGALVLHFVEPSFTKRAMELRSLGASSDYPDYKAHITLTYESDGIDPKTFPMYTGSLLFGPEKFKEIDAEKTWKNESLEESVTRQGFKSALELSRHFETKHPGVKVDLYDRTGGGQTSTHLSMIHVPKDLQKQGIGSTIMRSIAAYGDATGRTISLSPERQQRSPGKAKLVSWYRSHGFVPNKGRNKDFTISASMLRRPSK